MTASPSSSYIRSPPSSPSFTHTFRRYPMDHVRKASRLSQTMFANDDGNEEDIFSVDDKRASHYGSPSLPRKDHARKFSSNSALSFSFNPRPRLPTGKELKGSRQSVATLGSIFSSDGDSIYEDANEPQEFSLEYDSADDEDSEDDFSVAMSRPVSMAPKRPISMRIPVPHEHRTIIPTLSPPELPTSCSSSDGDSEEEQESSTLSIPAFSPPELEETLRQLEGLQMPTLAATSPSVEMIDVSTTGTTRAQRRSSIQYITASAPVQQGSRPPLLRTNSPLKLNTDGSRPAHHLKPLVLKPERSIIVPVVSPTQSYFSPRSSEEGRRRSLGYHSSQSGERRDSLSSNTTDSGSTLSHGRSRKRTPSGETFLTHATSLSSSSSVHEWATEKPLESPAVLDVVTEASTPSNDDDDDGQPPVIDVDVPSPSLAVGRPGELELDASSITNLPEAAQSSLSLIEMYGEEDDGREDDSPLEILASRPASPTRRRTQSNALNESDATSNDEFFSNAGTPHVPASHRLSAVVSEALGNLSPTDERSPYLSRTPSPSTVIVPSPAGSTSSLPSSVPLPSPSAPIKVRQPIVIKSPSSSTPRMAGRASLSAAPVSSTNSIDDRQRRMTEPVVRSPKFGDIAPPVPHGGKPTSTIARGIHIAPRPSIASGSGGGPFPTLPAKKRNSVAAASPFPTRPRVTLEARDPRARIEMPDPMMRSILDSTPPPSTIHKSSAATREASRPYDSDSAAAEERREMLAQFRRTQERAGKKAAGSKLGFGKFLSRDTPNSSKSDLSTASRRTSQGSVKSLAHQMPVFEPSSPLNVFEAHMVQVELLLQSVGVRSSDESHDSRRVRFE